MVLDQSSTINKYKQTMADCVKLFMPYIDKEELEPVLNYSVAKRFKDAKCKVVNSYTNKTANMTLLQVADYIRDREPIVTAFGTMFKRHGTVPNPLATVVQGFLDQREIDKGMMKKFPKGSEDFEKYNLLQALDKIDANGMKNTII